MSDKIAKLFSRKTRKRVFMFGLGWIGLMMLFQARHLFQIVPMGFDQSLITWAGVYAAFIALMIYWIKKGEVN